MRLYLTASSTWRYVLNLCAVGGKDAMPSTACIERLTIAQLPVVRVHVR